MEKLYSSRMMKTGKMKEILLFQGEKSYWRDNEILSLHIGKGLICTPISEKIAQRLGLRTLW